MSVAGYRSYTCLYVAAPVCMCVCVFLDCPGVTSKGLWDLTEFASLANLQLQRMSAIAINGQGHSDPWGWIKDLRYQFKRLYISGEIQRLTHFSTSALHAEAPPRVWDWGGTVGTQP